MKQLGGMLVERAHSPRVILTDLPASRAASEALSPSLSASEARTGATSLRATGRGAAATTGLVVAALKVADLVEYSMVMVGRKKQGQEREDLRAQGNGSSNRGCV
jgi:hypothetical protein